MCQSIEDGHVGRKYLLIQWILFSKVSCPTDAVALMTSINDDQGGIFGAKPPTFR
jgi:hypothetical protein